MSHTRAVSSVSAVMLSISSPMLAQAAKQNHATPKPNGRTSRHFSALLRGTVLCGVALLLVSAMCASAHAQVTYSNVQVVPFSGLGLGYGVAVDQYDDVFVADANNNRVLESYSNGSQRTAVSGLGVFYGVAVDQYEDLYIADTDNYETLEIWPSGQQFVLASNLISYGVAVDSAGYFVAGAYCAEYENGNCILYAQGIFGYANGKQVNLGTYTVGYPFSVAVDQNENLYSADIVNNTIWVYPYAGNGTWSPRQPLGSGLNQPYGVAVNGTPFQVFIADTYNNRVVEIPISNGGFGTQFQVNTGNYSLSLPTGIAVDASGNIFISDTYNARVLEVKPPSVNFGTVSVSSCPNCKTIPLTYNVASDTTFGTISALTQGIPNLDFEIVNGSTCTGVVTAGSTCTVTVAFAPTAPGNRMGAVELFDNNGNLLVTTLVHGVGQAPAVAFGPGTQTTVGSGFSSPAGLAVDAAGDVFIADSQNARVVKLPANGGGQITVPTSGLNDPFAVAVDGAGDLFIADYGSNQVDEIPYLGNGVYGTQTIVNTGSYTLGPPYGVAVDAAGNVFIADTLNNRVIMVPAAGSGQSPIALTDGFNSPTGVSVDAAGNLYVADWGNNRVVMIPSVGNGAYGSPSTLSSGGNGPWSTAVDAAGDVFISYADQSVVVEVPASGGYQPYVGSGLNFPYGVAVDSLGNVFVADTGNSRVVKVQRSQPPSLSFANTPVGGTSSDSPQSVTMQNIGNQQLNGTLTVGANFVQVPGSGTYSDCVSTVATAPGTICNLSISFEPQSVGLLNSTATFTDNALNAYPSMQSIALQGTGLTNTQTIACNSAPSSAAYGSSFTITCTGGGSGNPVVLTASGACSGAGSNSALYTMISGIGTCTVIANQAGNSIYKAAPQVTENVSATQATTATTLVSSMNPALENESITFTATVTGQYGGAATGSVIFKSGVTKLGTITLNNNQASLTTSFSTKGVKSITAQYVGDINNIGSKSSILDETVDSLFPSTTQVTSSLNPSYINQLVTLTATISSADGAIPNGETVTFTSGATTLGTGMTSNGEATLSTSTLPAKTQTIKASYAGDSDFAASSGTMSQTVDLYPTTTALSSSPNPSNSGQEVTLTAVVTTTGPTTPTGKVIFYNGTTSLGSAMLNGSGVATLNTTRLPVGSDSLTADYNGDAENAKSTSSVVTQTVN